MPNEIAIPNEQVAQIAEILMQYAPGGWTKLVMLFKTNEELTQIDSWAETPQNSDHGIHLDEEDADQVEAILGNVWLSSGKVWSVAEYTLDCDGNYTVSFK